MASGNLQQYLQVRLVIRECYKPDTTFRVASETKRTANLAFSQMPLECILMEVRSCLWETEYIVELQWFKMRYIDNVPWCQLALKAGMKYGSGNYIKERCDTMLDDAISKMPTWLFNRCLDIYDDHLKGGVNDKDW